MRCVLRVDDFARKPTGSFTADDGCLKLAQRFHQAVDGIPYLGVVNQDILTSNGRKWLTHEPEGLTVSAMWHGSPGYETSTKKAGLHLGKIARTLAHWGDVQDIAVKKPSDTFIAAVGLSDFRRIWLDWTDSTFPSRRANVLSIPLQPGFCGASTRALPPASASMLDEIERHANSCAVIVVRLSLPEEARRDPELHGAALLARKLRPSIIDPAEYASKLLEITPDG